MESRAKQVVIAGAGIGGLTAAIALQRAGFGVRVYERAPVLRPVVARELGAAGSLPAGLRRYEQARRARANAVVVTARRLGAIGQWRHPLACAVRDGLLSRLPASATLRQLRDAWLLP
jgi:2-polyprenyl-6-methoxyphenol hydroxylase-like FAD-dependent oxidoreductase